jgi:hypothetical protein
MTDLSKLKIADAFKTGLPVKSMAADLSSGFASLRCKGKMWNLNLGGKSYPIKDDKGYNLPYVDFVILGANDKKSRIYFPAWDEDNASGPICASLKGDVPDPGVSIPQSKTCAACPRSQWSVKPDGSSKPECQEHKRVAILLMPDMTRKLLPKPLLEPVFFKVPPGSFKTFKKYDDMFVAAGVQPHSVVTRVSFADDKQFEMLFEPVQALTAKEAPRVLQLTEDPQTKVIIGETPTMRQIPSRQAPPPQQIATGLMDAFGEADEDDDDEVEVIPPPKAKRAKKIETVIEAEPELAEPPPSESPGEEDGDEPWEESDTDLDATVAKLMNKTNNMLK